MSLLPRPAQAGCSLERQSRLMPDAARAPERRPANSLWTLLMSVVLALLTLAAMAGFGPAMNRTTLDESHQAVAPQTSQVLMLNADQASSKAMPLPERKLRKPVAVKLDDSQTLLALHISSHYRRALDFSRELVHHAYQVAREAQIDPLLVLAIISVESRFNPLAESPAGAQGLMQVLTRVHFAKFQPFGGVQAAFDPVANLRVGTAILKHYLQAHDTVPLALKAYVGAAQVDHDFGYGAKVMAAREELARIVSDAPGLVTSEPDSTPFRKEPAAFRPPSRSVVQDEI
jgi:soluble lytic murein transglycosylase-like protein